MEEKKIPATFQMYDQFPEAMFQMIKYSREKIKQENNTLAYTHMHISKPLQLQQLKEMIVQQIFGKF